MVSFICARISCIKGTIQCVVFCIWLLSLSIIDLRPVHALVCVRGWFLFIAEWFCSAWMHHIGLHQLMGIWAVSCFWWLWRKLLCAGLCVDVFSFLSGKYPGAGLLDRGMDGCFVRYCLFSKVTTPVCFQKGHFQSRTYNWPSWHPCGIYLCNDFQEVYWTCN